MILYDARMRRVMRPAGNDSARDATTEADRVRDIIASSGRKVMKARRRVLSGEDGEAIHIESGGATARDEEIDQ